MGNNSSRQYTYHQYYDVIKKNKNFDFSSINYDLLDPYEVLEVRKNFTWEELKDAYKYTALITHPDKDGGNQIVFNFVTDCFKKLAYEFKAKQQDKTFLDLKKQVEEYYSTQKGDERIPPPIDENFHERFNKTFNMCKIVSEDVEFGYGDNMIKSTDKREDFSQNNLFEKKKFDNKSFNQIFTNHILNNKDKEAPIVKYKDPEPMVLAKKMNYTEIGGKKPDDYSSSVEKEGKNSLIYTDYKKAYSTGRLVSQEELAKHKQFNSIEEYQSYRDNKFKKGLSDKEKNYFEQKKLKEEKEEQERLERIRNEDLRIKINNEKASRLFIR